METENRRLRLKEERYRVDSRVDLTRVEEMAHDDNTATNADSRVGPTMDD